MPPFAAVRVPLERTPSEFALTAPAPRLLNLTVLLANNVPKKGELEALNV